MVESDPKHCEGCSESHRNAYDHSAAALIGKTEARKKYVFEHTERQSRNQYQRQKLRLILAAGSSFCK